MSAPLQIGLLVFPRVTQLDFTGPLQVFANVPGAKLHLIWKRIEPVPSDSVLTLTPTTTFADCPQLDVICVPGGGGTDDLLNDEEVLDFLRRQAEGAKYVTSVCTGSLALGAAGLLKGYRAATHWSAMEMLSQFGATPTKTRVCVDRNRITGGGVTAGIDFALTLVSILCRPHDGGSDPASARIQSGAAVQFRLARHGIRRRACTAARAWRATTGPPSRSGRAGGSADDVTRPQRKRPLGFPSGLSCLTAAAHFIGRFRSFQTGGLSPDRVLVGGRCISGQSRAVARTERDGLPSP